MDSKKSKIIASAVLGAAAITVSALAARLQPSGSPFRSDVVTLVNDVGEKLVVLKSTIRPDAQKGKDLLSLLANQVKKDISEASKPVQRNEVSACSYAEQKSSEAAESKNSANSMRSEPFGKSLVEMYENQAMEAQKASSEYESTCQEALANIKKERARLRINANASKELIRIAAKPGAYKDYVPTYHFKAIITDVNGKSSVFPRSLTCLNENSIYVFSQERRKAIAPYAFVTFSKPEQIAIITPQNELPDIVRGDASQPSDDALNYAAQSVCAFKGHVSIEKDLAKSS